MKTVTLPNGKEVILNRLPDSAYERLRTVKVINSKKKSTRQDAKRVIKEQLLELEDEE